MLSKSKGQVLTINERRRDQQRNQAPTLRDIRQNNNKRPRHLAVSSHSNLRNTSYSNTNSNTASGTAASSSPFTGGQQMSRNSGFIISGSTPQPEQAPSSSSDTMSSAGNDPRKENKRVSSSKGNL